MLRQEMVFILTNVQTGTEFPITVKPLTLGRKADMDEWLRIAYIKRAMDSGISLKEAEQEAERLDMLANPWFLSENRRAARILFELARPNMGWEAFEDVFFSAEVRSFNDDSETDNPIMERLQKNVKVFTDAFEFSCKNPTKPASPDPNQTAKPTASKPSDSGAESTPS